MKGKLLPKMRLGEKTKRSKANAASGSVEYARSLNFPVGCMVYQVWTRANWMQKIS